MARVITFSLKYPSYHPSDGEPTLFVEKICKSFQQLGYDRVDLPDSLEFDLGMFYLCSPKGHTIRGGHRFKVGDKFSPRVWSGKPYNTKQITIAPDIEVRKIWNFRLEKVPQAENNIYGFLDDVLIDTPTAIRMAGNDGLTIKDFQDWFCLSPEFKKAKAFDGQIICWDEKIEY